MVRFYIVSWLVISSTLTPFLSYRHHVYKAYITKGPKSRPILGTLDLTGIMNGRNLISVASSGMVEP